MTNITTRKPTTEDLEEGYSNLNVEEIKEKLHEILCLDAYADEREDFVEFIGDTFVGRCLATAARCETDIEKKDHEIYERKIRGMNDCVDFMKSRQVEEVA